MAREALGVVGGVIGYIYGGPTGAQIGFAIGSSIGGYIDPIRIPHPGLSDAPIQTSRDGVPIPIIHGLHYCHGNILQKNPEEIVTTTERQGKGGSTKVETKTRFRTFAIGVCQGPIAEVTRIWANNKLVYDMRSSPAIPIAETLKYAEGITIYKGTEDQLPDPELEAHWTAAETPAYRGLCYIVWNNHDLTDTGGAIPQYAFEVNGSRDHTITSRPYPIENIESVGQSTPPADVQPYNLPPEGVDAVHTPQDGTLEDTLEEYTAPTEGVDAVHTPQDGTLVVSLESYEDWPVEGVDPTHTPQDGTLTVRLIEYTNWPAEGIDATHTPLDGTLE